MAEDDPTLRADSDDYLTRKGLGARAQVFGRYRLEALAGRGGMGVVWKARDERLERLVALKFLPEVVAGDPEAVRDLLLETKRCLELTHPHIVRVHDLVQDGLLAAIAMEYVDGESLAKRKSAAAAGCLGVEELAPLTAQLCAALDYAHRVAKVVHRDLKPANLLLTRDGQLKVTDFGIARSLSDTHTRLTGRVGNTSGTLLYMSPQQLKGEDPTASDDIYALGATLYELLTGKPPFHTGDVALQIREMVPKPVNQRLAALGLKPVPAAWAETIQACLAKEPKDRPQSAGEVAERLGLGQKQIGGAAADPLKPGSRYENDAAPTVVVASDSAAHQPVETRVVPTRSSASLRAGLAAAILVLAGLGCFFGVYQPIRQRAAAEQARQAELARERKEKERLDAAVLAKTNLEQRDYEAILARMEKVRDDAQRPDLDMVQQAVQEYLAAAPKQFKAGVEQAWERRHAAWSDYELSHRPCSLVVETDPTGATVILFPRNERKTSPAVFNKINPGEISFRVEKEGYWPQDQSIVIQPGLQKRPGLIRLIPLTGSAAIESEPAGVKVSLDGNSRHFEGFTPFRQTMIPPGSYQATLQRDNWLPVERQLTIKSNEEAMLSVDLRGVNLVVGSDPAGAQVTLNGREAGLTPLSLSDQPPGQYLIILSRDGYDPASRTIMLEKDLAVNMAMTQRTSKLATLVIYRESHILGIANSPTVRIDSQVVGQLPNGSYLTLQYPAGEYSVSVDSNLSVAGCDINVELLANETTHLKLSFELRNAGLTAGFVLRRAFEGTAKAVVLTLKPVSPTVWRN